MLVRGYLALGGLAAALMIVTGVRTLRGGRARARRSGLLPWAAPLLLSSGTLLLFLEQAQRFNVLRFYLAFRPAAPLWWSPWLLAAGVPVTILHAMLTAPPWLQDAIVARRPLRRLSTRLASCPLTTPRTVTWATVILGVALALYVVGLAGGLLLRWVPVDAAP